VQIRIWTCINNILKIYINIICGKGYFGGEICGGFWGENHVKLKMKVNSVICGQICIRLNGKEYLRNYSCKP